MKWIVLACVLTGIAVLGIGTPPPSRLLSVGWLERVAPASEAPRYVVLLPGGAAVVRALAHAEWASYQVRAESWQHVEAEMLAAAVVEPPLTAAEAGSLPKAVARALRQAVNAASGFAAFSEPGTEPAR